MDTFKVGAYSDPPENLEKNRLPAELIDSESRYACSTQPARNRGRQLSIKRHWIAFGTVAFIWLVFSCGRRGFYDQPPHAWGWDDEKWEHAPPPEGDVDQCVSSTNWTTYYDQPPWTPDYPYGAETTFSLPLDSDALYLISRGIFQQGLVNIEQSAQVSDVVDVRVRVAYFDDKHLEHATVCQMHRADGEHGVGIFTFPRPHRPPHRRPKRDLEFDVTVTLPTGNEGPLLVKKLETRLPNYSQTVTDLGESVLFEQISLTSGNGKLSVQSVTAEVGEFSLVNGDIEGHFIARSSLDLRIGNGRITPTVNLLHLEDAEPSHLTIHGINGEIDAEISLSSETSIGGEFEIDAQLNHGKLGLKFTDSPVDSILRCYAETTVGAIQAELDSAFEGTYSLENRLGPKLVSQHDVEDPAGRERRRVVSVNDSRGRVQGEVKWVESDGSSSGNEGSVVVKSILSPVVLVI